tara:strand:- start:1687 stop:2400 length:714 start_codon:yes stop_codon:yes gene_type:complete
MNDILIYLNERKEEFSRHYSIAKMLEQRLNDASSDSEMYVEVRHVNTVKSGLLVHLYNIVEAVSTRTLKYVGQHIACEDPKLWNEFVLHEWIRSEFWNKDQNPDTTLSHLTRISDKLISGNVTGVFNIKSATGSWDDQDIKAIAKRMGCKLVISNSVKRNAYEKKYRDNKNALEYLSLRRNAIAHGSSTFEEGAIDLTLIEVKELSTRVLPFLEEVTKSYEAYLNDKDYLKKEGVAA